MRFPWLVGFLLLISLTRPAAAKTPGLVAAYGFEETAGNTVTDVSGNGHIGTLVNAKRTAKGKFGRSLTFVSPSSYVTVPDAASLDLGASGTIAVWVKLTIPHQHAGLVHKGGVPDFSDEAYSLQLDGNGLQPAAYLNNGTTLHSLVDSKVLALGKWHHVAIVWDSSGMRLYLNGKLSTSVEGAFKARKTSGPLVLGAQALGQYGFEGTLDEVQIYNRALAAGEVVKVMNSPLNDPVTSEVIKGSH